MPLTIEVHAFREELVLCNATRFKDSLEGQSGDFGASILSVTRLPRCVKPTKGPPQWVPSSSMRVSVPRPLGEAILAHGSLVLGFRSVTVKLYNPPSALGFGVGGRDMLPSIAGALLPAGIVGNPTFFGSARIGAIGGGPSGRAANVSQSGSQGGTEGVTPPPFPCP